MYRAGAVYYWTFRCKREKVKDNARLLYSSKRRMLRDTAVRAYVLGGLAPNARLQNALRY